MSKINLTPNASGTGVFTIASPNSNTDYTMNLPEINGGTLVSTDASGNVGIGTDSPSSMGGGVNAGITLGSGGLVTLQSANNTAYLGGNSYFNGTNHVYQTTAAASALDISPTAGIPFRVRYAASGTGGTNISWSEAMRIDSSGKLLVGTTTAQSQKLQIVTNGSSVIRADMGTAASSNDISFTSQSAAASTSGWYHFLGQYGNGSTITTNSIFIAANGNITNLNNSYGAISDVRNKSNIVDANSQLDDIMAIKVRSYTLDATGETHIGVVAQELEEKGMSGLVEENEEGMKSVKYSILYMKAIKALQEAVAKIEDLESRLSAVEAN